MARGWSDPRHEGKALWHNCGWRRPERRRHSLFFSQGEKARSTLERDIPPYFRDRLPGWVVPSWTCFRFQWKSLRSNHQRRRVRRRHNIHSGAAREETQALDVQRPPQFHGSTGRRNARRLPNPRSSRRHLRGHATRWNWLLPRGRLRHRV